MAVRTYQSFFKKLDKDIIFVYNGKSELSFTKFQDVSATDTRVRVISGLNHFLKWVYNTKEEDTIDYVNDFICCTHIDCINALTSIEGSRQFAEDVDANLIRICSINDEKFVDIVTRYAIDCSENDVNESKATTNITLTNRNLRALNVIATLIKFTYIFASMLRFTKNYNETLILYMDKLCNNAYRSFLKLEGEDHTRASVDELSTEIDNFIINLVGYLWDRKANSMYKDKFRSIGKDSLTNSKKNKMDVLSAFKKFTPTTSEEYGSKFASGPDAWKMVYWTPDKDFKEFRLKNAANAGYIQSTLTQVVITQDLKETFQQEINVAEILVNANEESSMRRDNSLYEDKEAHLLQLRQNSAKKLFNMVVDEISQYEFDIRKELKLFNLDNTHPFNQFILSKLLLSLTGEQRVYKEFYGNFSKIFLALFYVKMVEGARGKFNYIAPVINLMKANGRPNNEIYKISTVEEFLEEKDPTVDPIVFRSILGAYLRDDNTSYILTIDVFYRLFKFLESPARVRNLLFPERYTNTDDIKGDIQMFTKIKVDYAKSVKAKVLEGIIYDKRSCY